MRKVRIDIASETPWAHPRDMPLRAQPLAARDRAKIK